MPRLLISVLRPAVCALALLLPLAGPARAQVADAAPAALDADTQRWLDDAVARAQAAAGLPLRMEVRVGSLDSRLRLAPCAKVEPHVPAGTRLWGRTRLGLRCVDGNARWNVFLPITIKAWGPAWVLRDNVLPGQVLTEADATLTEADWAADNSPVLADATQWVGLAASRALTGGQPLRQTMVKAPQMFSAGAQVRVVAGGPGFQIAATGQALTPGLLGQSVRIRMEGGRIASGTVVDERTVELHM
ncbi:MAG: flagellar basal body P-ring formation protein FlgA [Burkholderiaceae bacterium]|nr:flagellar basal body P-ring formation protein FlgA [Burkholderiaceae bacterium]